MPRPEPTRSTRRRLILQSAIAIAVLAAGCGDDDGGNGATSTTTGSAVTTTTTVEASTETIGESTTTDVSTTTVPAGLEQPAIWPAADVVFTSPEEVAADFVTNALRVPPVLGEFQQGDSRSGEIEVLFPGEGEGAVTVVRGLLFLRQLGPDHGWFVLGAVSEGATIEAPEPGSEVGAGPVTVSGRARGFEALVVVEAFIAGDPTVVDQAIASGGSLGTLEPFSAELDLSAVAPGEVITILIRGGVGLDTDPGEFAALPVVVGA